MKNEPLGRVIAVDSNQPWSEEPDAHGGTGGGDAYSKAEPTPNKTPWDKRTSAKLFAKLSQTQEARHKVAPQIAEWLGCHDFEIGTMPPANVMKSSQSSATTRFVRGVGTYLEAAHE